MNVEEIKFLLKSGDIARAETAAKDLLTAEPDNVQAKMLYGTCRQLQGDEETFLRLHDELAPRIASVVDGETQGLWRKYHTLWIGLIVTGLTLAGGVVAIAYFGRTVIGECKVATTALSAYRGPGYQRLQKSDSTQDVVSKWELEQGGTTNVMSLRENQTCPACNGTGLTCAKTRCKMCDGYGKGR